MESGFYRLLNRSTCCQFFFNTCKDNDVRIDRHADGQDDAGDARQRHRKALNEGEVAHELVFVGKGMLRQYYYKNGKDVTEHFSYEGCILMCIESLLKQVPTRLIIETLEPAVIYLFPYDKMMQLTKQNWEINMFYRKILEYSLIVSQTKADSWRFESARERYNLLLETHPEIIKRAPLAHIASYLLMTPETLSRVRSGVL